MVGPGNRPHLFTMKLTDLPSACDFQQSYARGKDFWDKIFLPYIQANPHFFERTSDSRFQVEKLSISWDPKFLNIYKRGKQLVKIMYHNLVHFSIDTLGGSPYVNINNDVYVAAM